MKTVTAILLSFMMVIVLTSHSKRPRHSIGHKELSLKRKTRKSHNNRGKLKTGNKHPHRYNNNISKRRLGGVQSGTSNIMFKDPPRPPSHAIKIPLPSTDLPIFVADKKKQKPIIVVPEIMIPHKVKRYVVHHDKPLAEEYKQLVYSMNPYWAHYARMNPYYENYVANSAGFNKYLLSPAYADNKSTLQKYLPII